MLQFYKGKLKKQAPSVIAVCLTCLVLTALSPVSAESSCKGDARIVGGVATTIDKYPWQVALAIPTPRGEEFCGGSLIAERWVLSAAHCFAESPQPNRSALKANVTNFENDGAWSEVERVYMHEDYDNISFKNDIALVKLKAPAPGQPVALAARALQLSPCEELAVTGWGRTADKLTAPLSPVLRVGKVPLVSNETCNGEESYGGRVAGTMLCAGFHDGGVDACQGDSGGPLVFERGREPVLVGVVSFGDGCAQKRKYGVYTRVSSFRDWIDKTMGSDGQ
jgi:secreted trypsin-like serine protease